MNSIPPIFFPIFSRIFPKFYRSFYSDKKEMEQQVSFDSEVVGDIKPDLSFARRRSDAANQIDGKSIENFISNFIQVSIPFKLYILVR